MIIINKSPWNCRFISRCRFEYITREQERDGAREIRFEFWEKNIHLRVNAASPLFLAFLVIRQRLKSFVTKTLSPDSGTSNYKKNFLEFSQSFYSKFSVNFFHTCFTNFVQNFDCTEQEKKILVIFFFTMFHRNRLYFTFFSTPFGFTPFCATCVRLEHDLVCIFSGVSEWLSSCDSWVIGSCTRAGSNNNSRKKIKIE